MHRTARRLCRVSTSMHERGPAETVDAATGGPAMGIAPD